LMRPSKPNRSQVQSISEFQPAALRRKLVIGRAARAFGSI
jgi:hypothetical protein